jgi:chromosomal replication initiator protein
VSNRDIDGSQLEFGDDEQIVALRKAWDRTIRSLAPKLTATSKSYLNETEPISWDGDLVVLASRSRFAREWIQNRHGEALRSQLALHLFQPLLQIKIVLATADSVREPLAPRVSSEPETDAQQEVVSNSLVPVGPRQPGDQALRRNSPPARRKPIPADLTMPLNAKYTFEHFVVGKSNRLAHAGAMAVANNPGLTYNPLFLYGAPGLGKTHLMHAIGNAILANNPDARIAFVSGESFTNNYIAALRENKSEQFRAVYRNVDVWLVDDIQMIAGKEHTKEEFFHTFNTLQQLGRQIVVSSDKPPRDLRLKDDRLRTRFESGLMADVAPPEIEMRIAILEQKAMHDNLDVPHDVLAYMAGLIQSNIRTLEGALIRLSVCASVADVPATKELARDVLSAFFVEHRPVMSGSDIAVLTHEGSDRSPLRALPLPPLASRLGALHRSAEEQLQRIVDAVADHFSIDPGYIFGNGSAAMARRREIAAPRQIAMYLAREKTPMPVGELAYLFGGVDHSAIVHAHRKMAARIQDEPQLMAILQAIQRKLDG